MKIWKVSKKTLIAYVKVPDDCKIIDTSYAVLQLVRKLHKDGLINGTQLLSKNEQIKSGIPVYSL